MNIKHLCLIAGLLSLPVAFANAADITINVPIDILNLPAANRTLTLECVVRSATHENMGGGGMSFAVDKNFNGTKQITIRQYDRKNLDDATTYQCVLSGAPREPALSPRPVSNGDIPR